MNSSTQPNRPAFTFDGRGINGPDEYRSRLATITDAGHALNLGPKLADLLNAQSTQAPDLSALVKHYDGGEPRLSFDYMEPDDVRAYVATQAAQIEGLRAGLEAARRAFYTLASEAGDVAIWNKGGEAYEAAQQVKAALSNLPAAPSDNDALRQALQDIANAGESGPLAGTDMHAIKAHARAALSA